MLTRFTLGFEFGSKRSSLKGLTIDCQNRFTNERAKNDVTFGSNFGQSVIRVFYALNDAMMKPNRSNRKHNAVHTITITGTDTRAKKKMNHDTVNMRACVHV